MIEESLGYHQIHHRVIWESVSTQAIIRAVAKKIGDIHFAISFGKG